MFEHEFFPRKELQNTDTEWGRYYTTPIGRLPSVTTVLKYSNWFDTSALDSWKERVGKDEADRISSQALGRGNVIHSMAQKYLMNESDWDKGIMPINVITFQSLAKSLDRNVGLIYGIEYPLYSAKRKTAGRADLIAEWGSSRDQGGDPVALIDFKTSKRPKKAEEITAYFVQATVYALMFEEMWNFPEIDDVVILIAVDHEPLQTFQRSKKEFLPIVEALFPMRGLDGA